MTKQQEQWLVEARHIMRKHVVKSRHAGRAVTYRCRECESAGADTVSNVTHSTECRYATLMVALGESILWKTDSQKEHGATRKASTPTIVDPMAAVDSCTS